MWFYFPHKTYKVGESIAIEKFDSEFSLEIFVLGSLSPKKRFFTKRLSVCECVLMHVCIARDQTNDPIPLNLACWWENNVETFKNNKDKDMRVFYRTISLPKPPPPPQEYIPPPHHQQPPPTIKIRCPSRFTGRLTMRFVYTKGPKQRIPLLFKFSGSFYSVCRHCYIR